MLVKAKLYFALIRLTFVLKINGTILLPLLPSFLPLKEGEIKVLVEGTVL